MARTLANWAWLHINSITMLLAVLYAAQFVTAQREASTKKYEPASVSAASGLQCRLHALGTDLAQGIPVTTDSDGYARFYAVRAGGGNTVNSLALDCTDSSGRPSSYSVDLTSSATFAPNPLNPASEPGTDRPRLTGNPMQYSQSQLIQQGYGFRPDPQTSPGATRAGWQPPVSAGARFGQ